MNTSFLRLVTFEFNVTTSVKKLIPGEDQDCVCALSRVRAGPGFLRSSSAARDNKGTEFILTFPENLHRQNLNPKLFIACPHPGGAAVEITLSSTGYNTRERVTYGRVTEVEVDRAAVELVGSRKSDKSVHVTSDVEIVVYGVFAEKFSSDAYLALPTDVMGTEYFASCAGTPSDRPDRPAELGVVGVHDGTTVTIVPSQAVTFDGQNYAACRTDVFCGAGPI
uniref:IgGFc-binding protein N-terminal domain-containing protein n=1 Tax=Branchiostoma floridae TaxID=7739 RepID=C3Z5G7_BRAFL|eukprot:XP_002596068.1 hypothetical protein BRAFLDRAFT_66201 [Branchiostoma floridae]